MTTWPPTIDELKTELKIDLPDTREDARLTTDLAAAVAWVQKVKPGFRYDITNPAQIALPDPTPDLRLGTLRMASRWNDRRRSRDGMVSMGEMGMTRVSSYDNDIDRMLGLGKFAPMTDQIA